VGGGDIKYVLTSYYVLFSLSCLKLPYQWQTTKLLLVISVVDCKEIFFKVGILVLFNIY
jgi:hypothetical protein